MGAFWGLVIGTAAGCVFKDQIIKGCKFAGNFIKEKASDIIDSHKAKSDVVDAESEEVEETKDEGQPD